MIPRRFGEISSELARIAGQTGMRIDDTRVMDQTNLVVERLMNEGNLPQCFARLRFTNNGRLIALPLGYDALIKVAVDDTPRPIQNGWYEFLQHGPGPQDEVGVGWSSHIVEYGESPFIIPPDQTAIEQPAALRLYSFADERDSGMVRPKVRLLGYDENGDLVRTDNSGVWFDGEDVELAGDVAAPNNFQDTTNSWSKIVTAVKPATNAKVEAYWLDNAAVEHFAGLWGYSETDPMYRLYLLPEIDETTEITIKALCRRRFIPIRQDNDLLLISNLNALRMGMIALRAEESAEWPAAEEAWGRAREILAKEARNYMKRRPFMDWDADTTGFGGIAQIS